MRQPCGHRRDAGPPLTSSFSVGVVGNTTSSPADQIELASRADVIELISEFHGDGLFPILLCPPNLFLEIIRINHLRRQTYMASYHSPNREADCTRDTAEDILLRLSAFSPEEWADSNNSDHQDPYRVEWQLLGHIYESAVAIYCISSLQSLCVLPVTKELQSMRSAYGKTLFASLKVLLLSPRTKMWMMWALVVAGIEAAHTEDHPASAKKFVSQNLTNMAKSLGTPLPLVAKEALEKFWFSGKTAWDDCFVDMSYAFIT